MTNALFIIIVIDEIVEGFVKILSAIAQRLIDIDEHLHNACIT